MFVEGPAFLPGFDTGGFHGRFYFRATPAFGSGRQVVDIESFGVLSVETNVYGEDLRPFTAGGQVQEKQLVETPLAHQFSGQLLYAVGRGREKHAGRLFLHPGQKTGKDVDVAAGGAAVVMPESIFQLVYPELEFRVSNIVPPYIFG